MKPQPGSTGGPSHRADHFITCEIPAGTFFYAQYPYPRPVFYRLGWEGAVEIQRLDEHSFRIECQPGESLLYFCGGPELPQAVEHLEAAQSLGCNTLLAETRANWLAFAAAHSSWNERLPAAAPLRSELLQSVDDIAVLIRAQQVS